MRNVIVNRVNGEIVEEVFDDATIAGLKSLDMITFTGTRGAGKYQSKIYTVKRS